MKLNICLHCIVETVEEAELITDTIKSVMASHTEMAMSSTVNERLEPREKKLNPANNPTKEQ